MNNLSDFDKILIIAEKVASPHKEKAKQLERNFYIVSGLLALVLILVGINIFFETKYQNYSSEYSIKTKLEQKDG